MDECDEGAVLRAHVAVKLLRELSHVLLKFALVLLFLFEVRHVVSYQLARNQKDTLFTHPLLQDWT